MSWAFGRAGAEGSQDQHRIPHDNGSKPNTHKCERFCNSSAPKIKEASLQAFRAVLLDGDIISQLFRFFQPLAMACHVSIAEAIAETVLIEFSENFLSAARSCALATVIRNGQRRVSVLLFMVSPPI